MDIGTDLGATQHILPTLVAEIDREGSLERFLLGRRSPFPEFGPLGIEDFRCPKHTYPKH